MVQHNGGRRNLTLGKIPKSEVTAFCANLDWLLEHIKFGGRSLPQRLQAWVSELSERHKRQLSELGLFDHRKRGITVGELLDAYLDDYEKRSDVTASSKTKVRSSINNRFDKIRGAQLEEIEPAVKSTRQNADPIWTDEAKQILTIFNSWQRNHYSVATWTRDNRLFSSIGIWAVKHGYCDHNPFSELPCVSMVNNDRNRYVTRDEALDAMEATVSPDIRLTIAMGRFAGLRICSEVRTIKWSHVDFDAGTLTVIDSKKKRERVMPLFSDIRAELERQQKHTGTTRFVASEELRSSSTSANYQRVREAILRSGQEPWVRTRQNLRASCENDLLELFEERLVTAWLGHTVKVSRSHYQKLRPEDYRRAIERADAVSE